jgi:solute carrier family 45 protein 1/2/4
MIFGSFVVAFCLIVLGWTAEIVAMFVTEPEKVLFFSLEPAVLYRC